MTSINQTLQEAKAKVIEAKAHLERFISDKEGITLQERWETWLEAPDFLKNTTKFVHHFEAFKDLAEGEFEMNSFEQDVLYEHDSRGSRIEMESWDEWLFNIATGTTDAERWENADGKAFTMKHYDAWREEVLAGNIGFVNFVW